VVNSVLLGETVLLSKDVHESFLMEVVEEVLLIFTIVINQEGGTPLYLWIVKVKFYSACLSVSSTVRFKAWFAFWKLFNSK
jgi:hypothetical protein